MKHKRKYQKEAREKPRTCDPYMCERCVDLGGGDFLCTFDPEKPEGIIVCKNWESTKERQWCKRRGRQRREAPYAK